MAYETTYLMHHGIKGMKWGVRRTPEQLGHRKSESGRVSRSDKRLAKKTIKEMSKIRRSSNPDIDRYESLQLKLYKPTDKMNSKQVATYEKTIDKATNKYMSDKGLRAKLSDPAFQKRVKTGAKIAVTVAAVYATHKVINDPKVLASGKKLMDAALQKSGGIKTSMMNTTEFKMLSAAKAPASKAWNLVKSDSFAKGVAGIGAMAGTAGIIRSQVKDLKNKPEGDAFDRAVTRTQQLSSIGTNVNKLARGPMGQDGSSGSSYKSSNNSGSISKKVTDKMGPPSNKGVDKQSKAYQDLFKGQSEANRTLIKKLASNGYDVDQIRKFINDFDSQFDHSGLRNIQKGSYLLHKVY